MTPSLLSASTVFLLLLLAAPAQADRFRPEGRYDARIPAPASILGFEPGERPARYEQVVRYAEALAGASPRVRLERYARSHEGRDLLLLVISSERNLARLEEIRRDVAALADPRRPLAGTALRTLLDRTPAIAYMAYAIHGDELSSTDAALRLAYELAAGENPDVSSLLENLVILVDPVENPDGRERILAMIASYQGAVPNPDPEALNHAGFWPWGRGNHYLFDLNRDWFAQVHPESRGRATILRRWRPQLVVDSHEMGYESTYLFSPPRDPFNPNLPRSTRSWWERFAADQARAFDLRGWSYYTREWNEEFFPGYGSAIALYQGAVGILYEQAGTSGQSIRKPSGRVEHYQEAVAHQFTSSMANLTTAAAHRRELLAAYRDARAEAVAAGRRGARVFYFAPAPDALRAQRLASRLAALGIEVERLESAGNLSAAHTFWEDGARRVTLPAGSFRVRLDQPDGLLARAVLEPHTSMPESSLAQEREHLERQKETRLYDVTAWSPLLASGLTTWWTSQVDGLKWRRIDPAAGEATPQGRVREGNAAYGWLFDGVPDASVLLASRLAARGHAVRVAEEPFALGGRRYARGAFLLRQEENPSGTADSLRALAVAAGVEVIPVASARITDGADLGGDRWGLLRPARIAIAAGAPLDFTSVGWAWQLLDQEHGVRASLLDVTRIGSVDLARYNVLVLPNAWDGAEDYRRALGDEGIREIKEWIEAGGTLVALGRGAEFVADDSTRLSGVRLRANLVKDFSVPLFGLDEESIRSLERLQAMGLGSDGKALLAAGPYGSAAVRPAALRIPGPGSPVLGPGTWQLLGAEGEAARRRGPLLATRAASPKEKESEKPSAPMLSEAEQELTRRRADERNKRFLPSGAILRVDLDPEHWLAHGFGERLAVMANASEVLMARDPVVTVGRFTAPPALHLGGLLWPEAAARIALTAYATREPLRRGQIILFASDPNFRGYFWGTQRLFLNAVLLGPGLGTAPTTPW
jgi:hypothetical protein